MRFVSQKSESLGKRDSYVAKLNKILQIPRKSLVYNGNKIISG